jgi:hypothetical protein
VSNPLRVSSVKHSQDFNLFQSQFSNTNRLQTLADFCSKFLVSKLTLILKLRIEKRSMPTQHRCLIIRSLAQCGVLFFFLNPFYYLRQDEETGKRGLMSIGYGTTKEIFPRAGFHRSLTMGLRWPKSSQKCRKFHRPARETAARRRSESLLSVRGHCATRQLLQNLNWFVGLGDPFANTHISDGLPRLFSTHVRGVT